MHARVHLGTTESGGVQSTSHLGGNDPFGKDENKGKLQGVWRVNGCLFPTKSYGDSTW